MTTCRSVLASSSDVSQSSLGPRLTRICQLIRIAAVVWVGWALFAITRLRANPAALERNYGRAVGADISGASTAQHLGSFAIVLVDVAISALIAVIVWRLFGHFLAGRILDVRAVDDMRCLGWVGVAAMVFDVLARPVVAAILSSHVAEVPNRFPIWTQPHDLLHLMMALFVVVLASVLRRGVALADEHRQII